jgi:hypothetical protein
MQHGALLWMSEAPSCVDGRLQSVRQRTVLPAAAAGALVGPGAPTDRRLAGRRAECASRGVLPGHTGRQVPHLQETIVKTGLVMWIPAAVTALSVTSAVVLMFGGLAACASVPMPHEQLAVTEGAVQCATSVSTRESANQALSDRRAQAVMDALMGLGVQSAHLSSRGVAEGRQMNRRVELIFSPEESDSLMR